MCRCCCCCLPLGRGCWGWTRCGLWQRHQRGRMGAVGPERNSDEGKGRLCKKQEDLGTCGLWRRHQRGRMGAVGPERNSDEGKGRLCKSKKIWGHVDCGEGISGGGWVLLALKETVMRVKVGYAKARRSGDMWIVAKASAGEDGCC